MLEALTWTHHSEPAELLMMPLVKWQQCMLEETRLKLSPENVSFRSLINCMLKLNCLLTFWSWFIFNVQLWNATFLCVFFRLLTVWSFSQVRVTCLVMFSGKRPRSLMHVPMCGRWLTVTCTWSSEKLCWRCWSSTQLSPTLSHVTSSLPATSGSG